VPILPWECAVRGVPASLQGSSRKRQDWRQKVTLAARARWPIADPPLEVPVAVTMIFLHYGQPVDVDNMLKPTLDALVGIVYDDDRRVDQVVGRRQELSVGLAVTAISPVLARTLVHSLSGEDPSSICGFHGRPISRSCCDDECHNCDTRTSSGSGQHRHKTCR
jgi:crossover junction endodeoxyribonuclease RusA